MNEADDSKPLAQRDLLVLFTMQAAAFTGLGLALWYWSGRPVEQFLILDITDAFSGIVLGLALAAFGWATSRIFPGFAEKMTRLQAKNFAFLADKFPFPAIVLLSICAGVGEEALFRGGLQTLFADWAGPHAAILVSSTLFALIHLARPVITGIIFGIGVFFGYVYWLTDSLLLVMIAHTIYDIFAISALKKQFHILGLFDDDTATDSLTPDDNQKEFTDAEH